MVSFLFLVLNFRNFISVHYILPLTKLLPDALETPLDFIIRIVLLKRLLIAFILFHLTSWVYSHCFPWHLLFNLAKYHYHVTQAHVVHIWVSFLGFCGVVKVAIIQKII
jgi:hypothetical protein